MSEVCPYCEKIVGKLHHACGFCHIHYCDDCIPPNKHYCPSYREEDSKIVPSTNASPTISPDEACRRFAKKNTENEVEVPFLTLHEIKKRVAEGNGTLDSYICPTCITVRDVDRYACVHCNTERIIKCEWCGNHFCGVCVKPERHDCLEYERELRKSSYSEPPVELIDTSEQEIVIDTTSEIIIAPTSISTSFSTPTPAPITNPVIAPVPEPEVEPKPVVQVIHNKLMEEESVKVENKVSLWQKLLSIFGFGN
jgi:predicted nucleic acid binding AN1-type Zn finger protein